MNNFLNDPLGAMTKGISSAHSTITENAKNAAENIKNNEQLRLSLLNVKERAGQGFQSASTAAGSVAGRF